MLGFRLLVFLDSAAKLSVKKLNKSKGVKVTFETAGEAEAIFLICLQKSVACLCHLP